MAVVPPEGWCRRSRAELARLSPRLATEFVLPSIVAGVGVSMVGAIVALGLPGRRRTAETAPVGAVPALEGAGGS
jgi:hypothetical protein